jgi:hypothetical protein
MIKKILVAAAVAAATIGAQASTNLVSNGSLDGSTSDYTYNGAPPSVTTYYGSVPVTTGTVTDWTGSFVSITSSSGPWGTPSSLSGFDQATFGNYIAGVQADGVLSQQLDLAAGTYQLTWSDANRGADQTYSVSFDGVTYQSYTTVGGAGWGTQSLVFTTGGGTGLLSFAGDTSFHDRDATSFIDNVSLTAAVPEPASLLMMAVGTLGLLAWRRRAQV